MAIVTHVCQFVCYENLYRCENTWLVTGREKVMAIITPTCQFLCYENMYMCENTQVEKK